MANVKKTAYVFGKTLEKTAEHVPSTAAKAFVRTVTGHPLDAVVEGHRESLAHAREDAVKIQLDKDRRFPNK